MWMEFKYEARFLAELPLPVGGVVAQRFYWVRKRLASFFSRLFNHGLHGPHESQKTIKALQAFFILLRILRRGTQNFPARQMTFSVGKLANAMRVRRSSYFGNNSVTFYETFGRHALPVATPGAEGTSLEQILLAIEVS